METKSISAEETGFLILPEPLFSLIKGLEKKAITNFFGSPGSGKTNICLISAIEVLKKGGQVVYIDTEGSFSLDRFRQLSGRNDKFLEKIKLLEPKNFQEQGKFVREIENIETDLVILDSAVSLYRLESSTDQANIEKMEASKELSKQLSILSNIARDRKIPVLITAHTFKNWDNGENEIIGGDSVKYWSKCMVLLERTNKTGERKATVIKHRSIEEGKTTKFQIVEDGIRPSKFSIF